MRSHLPILITFSAVALSACITFDPIVDQKARIDLTPPPDEDSSNSSDGSGDDSGNQSGMNASPTCTSPAECVSGFCADGVCCNEACTDACVRCDGESSKGTCTPITGTPTGAHPACDTTHPTCGGACNGVSRECAYPTADARCGASCEGVCSGDGACTTVGDCPDHFACIGTSCATSCTTAADCAPHFDCNAPTCVRQPEADCLDGADDNGDGLADCQDPTCISQVECVPSANAGDKIGLPITGGSCPANYTQVTETYYSGISNGSCTGCTCNSSCTQTVRYKTVASSNCSNVINTRSVSRTSDGSGALCASISSINTSDAHAILDSTGTLTCFGSGSPIVPTTTFTTTTFCVAKTSATCDATHACVAKQASPTCAHTTSGVCPGAYPTPTGTYYGSVNPATCNACGASACTPGGTCTVGSTGFFQVGTCSGASTNFSTTCTDYSGTGISANSMTVSLTLSGGGVCALANTVNASGNDPTLICCE